MQPIWSFLIFILFWCFFYKYISFPPVVLLTDLCTPLLWFCANETCSPENKIMCVSGLWSSGRDGPQKGFDVSQESPSGGAGLYLFFDENWSIEVA